MPQKQLQVKDLAFSGKMIKDVDPLTIGDNFQSLINMRYNRVGIEAINGMTKINTSVINATYLEIKNAIQFRKDNSSYALAQSFNIAGTASRVYYNTTAIPSQGNFNATELHADPASTNIGRFSNAPGGAVCYSNGDEESQIWGGEVSDAASFLMSDEDGNFYNYTEAAGNSLTDINNLISFPDTTGGYTSDANTLLWLKFDNNLTDSSPATPHTVTEAVGTITYTTDPTIIKQGTHAAFFTGDVLTIPDNADFDFSSGIFTLDRWIHPTNLTGNQYLYAQETDADNEIVLYITNTGLVVYRHETGGVDVQITSGTTLIQENEGNHIRISGDGSTYYMFINGRLVGSNTSATKPANLTGLVFISSNVSSSSTFIGYMDEIRVSNVCRSTTNFIPQGSAIFYIGSLLPIKEIGLYSNVANTSLSQIYVEEYITDWSDVTNLVDGTDVGGIPLAQTGNITFDTTVLTSNQRVLNNQKLFWYKVVVSNVTSGTKLYQAHINYDMQKIQDIWNGVYRTAYSVQVFDGTTYADYTTNALDEDYLAASAATYVNLNSFPTTKFLFTGFLERMDGLFIVMGESNTASETLTVEYWSGSAWVAVSGLVDSTEEGGISLAKSGTILWNAPASTTEFKNSTLVRDNPFYYYRLTWSNTLSANTEIDQILGIPAPIDLGHHRFSATMQDRLWLCNRTDKAVNSATCSATNTAAVFNGNDTITIYFGDDSPLIASTDIYAQFGSNLYNVMIFCKESETWIIVGNSLATWFKYRASATKGCAAPLTMTSIHIDPDVAAGNNLNVAFWQTANDVVMFNGRNPLPIDLGVSEYFNQNSTLVTPINPDMITKSSGFFDKEKQEYHWCIATGTSTELNVELVYSILKKGWFEIDRGTGKNLHGGFNTVDTNGNTYNYGFNDTGYLWRLENGASFDGETIDYTVHFGDMIFAENGAVEDGIEYFKLRARNNATGVIATLYQDTKTVAEYTYDSVTLNKSDRRVSDHRYSGPRTPFFSASLKLTGSSSTVAPCFEPINLTFNWFIDKISRS